MKGLKSQNLRDHMSEAELIFTALAELSTRQIAESTNATGMNENEAAANTGGGIAKRARLELEGKTGKRVVSAGNYLPPSKKIDSGIKGTLIRANFLQQAVIPEYFYRAVIPECFYRGSMISVG